MKLWALVKHPRRGWKIRGKESCKEKETNTIIDLVMKQKNAMASGTNVVGNAFLKFIDQVSEDKSHKKMIREEKLKLEQDRIMTMDTSSMTPDQVAYI